jgi:hypothetical protein
MCEPKPKYDGSRWWLQPKYKFFLFKAVVNIREEPLPLVPKYFDLSNTGFWHDVHDNQTVVENKIKKEPAQKSANIKKIKIPRKRYDSRKSAGRLPQNTSFSSACTSIPTNAATESIMNRSGHSFETGQTVMYNPTRSPGKIVTLEMNKGQCTALIKFGNNLEWHPTTSIKDMEDIRREKRTKPLPHGSYCDSSS